MRMLNRKEKLKRRLFNRNILERPQHKFDNLRKKSLNTLKDKCYLSKKDQNKQIRNT
jgi:hypothetical protein